MKPKDKTKELEKIKKEFEKKFGEPPMNRLGFFRYRRKDIWSFFEHRLIEARDEGYKEGARTQAEMDADLISKARDEGKKRYMTNKTKELKDIIGNTKWLVSPDMVIDEAEPFFWRFNRGWLNEVVKSVLEWHLKDIEKGYRKWAKTHTPTWETDNLVHDLMGNPDKPLSMQPKTKSMQLEKIKEELGRFAIYARQNRTEDEIENSADIIWSFIQRGKND